MPHFCKSLTKWRHLRRSSFGPFSKPISLSAELFSSLPELSESALVARLGSCVKNETFDSV
jgi:hypothetical protein